MYIVLPTLLGMRKVVDLSVVVLFVNICLNAVLYHLMHRFILDLLVELMHSHLLSKMFNMSQTLC